MKFIKNLFLVGSIVVFYSCKKSDSTTTTEISGNYTGSYSYTYQAPGVNNVDNSTKTASVSVSGSSVNISLAGYNFNAPLNGKLFSYTNQSGGGQKSLNGSVNGSTLSLNYTEQLPPSQTTISFNGSK